MPLYVYACRQCGRQFEVRQSFQDDALTDCNVCGGAVRRLLQPVGIVFKGSGFYSTDYKTASIATPGSPDGASEGLSEGSKPADGATPAAPAAVKEPATASTKEGPGGATPA